MIKPNLLTCWPKDVYYPFFVKRINKDRRLFERVIVVMTEGDPGFNETAKVGVSLEDSLVLSPNILELANEKRSWYDVAMNTGLLKVDSSHVLFMEQDFFVEDGFFEKLFSIEGFNTIGFKDNNRLHPSCLLVKKETLDRTSKDFNAYPPEDDHFAKITKELMGFENWTTLQALDLDGWYHMAGLTHNTRMDRRDQTIPYRPDEYKLYKLLSQLA